MFNFIKTFLGDSDDVFQKSKQPNFEENEIPNEFDDAYWSELEEEWDNYFDNISHDSINIIKEDLS